MRKRDKSCVGVLGIALVGVALIGMMLTWLSENGYLAKLDKGGALAMLISIAWVVKVVWRRCADPAASPTPDTTKKQSSGQAKRKTAKAD